MKIKKLFFVIIITLFIGNTVFAQSAGIPLSEYNSLKDLYNSTLGEEWTNNTNWLDTTNHSVSDWFGITVENEHITQILLSNNNLQNTAFDNHIDLPNLRLLELGGNILNGFNFSAIDSLHSLDTFMLYENHLIFEDIEPAFSTFTYSNFSNYFYYSPQAKIDYSENIEIAINENHTFSILEEFLSPNDQFQWYKEGIKIDGETNSIISFSPVTKADSGSYYLEITNTGVPDLVLKSHYKSLYVTEISEAGVPISEYNALVDFYNNLNGNNWTRNDNWLDTINHTVDDWFGITVEGGHVTQIYFDAYYNYNLDGSLPSSIRDLKELKKLAIITDNISGELPSGLFELTKLEELYIAECAISGNIPQEIGNLTKLKALGLEANRIEGTIPSEIGNLTNLEFLSLYENRLSGEIPISISQLTNLYYLGLAYNNLSGTIPSSFGNLIKLVL